jgi:hypothetical protein
MSAPTRTLSRHSTWIRADRYRVGCGVAGARVQYQAKGTTSERPWGVVAPFVDRKGRGE